MPDLLLELRLDPAEWSVAVDYTKGVLSGGRGAVVSIRNLKTGAAAKRSAQASTKNEARRAARNLACELLLELSGRGR